MIVTARERQPIRVFVSHGKEDTWVASQIASRIRSFGASPFLDEADIAKGDNFKRIIHAELSKCDELIALFTPWSAQRFWVWVEVGAAWAQNKRIIAVLYGVTIAELEKLGGSKAILEDINVVELNNFDGYFRELESRTNSRA